MNKFLLTSLVASGLLLTAAAPLGFPTMPQPEDNPSSAAKIALGRQLFYDPILSRDGTVSCSTCHQQAHAFADPRALSLGVGGSSGARNAPSLGNVGYRKKLLWNGASPRLELQAMIPLTDHREMDMTEKELVEKLGSSKSYLESFKEVFGEKPSVTNLVRALGAFQRTLVSANSPYDRFRAGEDAAMSASARRGLALFQDKAECFHCHVGNQFSDSQPHNNAFEQFNADLGLGELSGKDDDIGKFITPSLRNVALTAPYMHDGSMNTLRDVVQHYNEGGQPNLNTDPLIRPLNLSSAEVDDLVAFLESLSDGEFIKNPDFAAPPSGKP